MATLTFTPDPVNNGQQVVVDGDGFAASSFVTLSLVAPGGISMSFDVATDEDGSFASTDEANPATATLTSDATIPTADDTVVIDSVTYTFKASPGATANEVKLGANAAAALANLKKAINLTGVAGTDYGSATVIHPTVKATTLTATTLKLVAKTGGTAGNALASTEGSTHLSFGDTTFVDTGSAATGKSQFRFTPGTSGKWVLTATDGVDTATAELQVWHSG